jgi:hypothetical protein
MQFAAMGNFDTKVDCAEGGVFAKEGDSTKEDNFAKDGNFAKRGDFTTEDGLSREASLPRKANLPQMQPGWGYSAAGHSISVRIDKQRISFHRTTMH